MNPGSGEWVCRWATNTDNSRFTIIEVGQLVDEIEELPGRWRVAVNGQPDFSRWHRATIIRRLRDANEAATIVAAQLGVIRLAEEVASRTPCGQGPQVLWDSVNEVIRRMARMGVK